MLGDLLRIFLIDIEEVVVSDIQMGNSPRLTRWAVVTIRLWPAWRMVFRRTVGMTPDSMMSRNVAGRPRATDPHPHQRLLAAVRQGAQEVIHQEDVQHRDLIEDHDISLQGIVSVATKDMPCPGVKLYSSRR